MKRLTDKQRQIAWLMVLVLIFFNALYSMLYNEVLKANLFVYVLTVIIAIILVIDKKLK